MVAAVLLLISSVTDPMAWLLVASGVTFLWLREYLTPLINKLRDEQLIDKKKESGARFNKLHKLSEQVNYGQFTLYIVLIGWFAYRFNSI